MSLDVTIKRNSDARGLAIIVTNDYENSPNVEKLRPIPGTIKDGENMRRAFRELHFSVHWERNIPIDRFQQLIQEAKHFSKYRKLKNYICIAFVFSGHGKSGDYIYMQDGNLVCIGKDIIESFLPENCPNMGTLSKLFFFDACRGEKDMQAILVPKGGTVRNTDEFGHRGAKKIEMKQIPPGSGFLVAYSTLPNYQAWEHPEEGGAWLTKLAEKITTSTSSIDDVLTEVNEELLQRENNTQIQQPEKLSRLNKKIFLRNEPRIPEPRQLKIAAVFPNPTPSQSSDVVQPNQTTEFLSAESNLDHWQSLPSVVMRPELTPQQTLPLTGSTDNTSVHTNVQLNQLLQQFPNAKFKDFPHFNEEHKTLYYRSTLCIAVSDNETLTGDSMEYFISKDLSRDKASENVLKELDIYNLSLSQNDCTSPGCTPVLTMPNVPKGKTETTSLPGNACKDQMNSFFQRNKINPQYEYRSENSMGPTQYCCIVRYIFAGENRKIESGQYYSKQDAKEHVARQVLKKEAVQGVECLSSRSSSIGGASPPPSKVFKSQLKEYFDKGSRAKDIKYETFTSGSGFVSTVSIVGINSCVQIQGNVCRSKQEAEQSAACQALRKLKQDKSI